MAQGTLAAAATALLLALALSLAPSPAAGVAPAAASGLLTNATIGEKKLGDSSSGKHRDGTALGHGLELAANGEAQ
jgi:hypothetical protein